MIFTVHGMRHGVTLVLLFTVPNICCARAWKRDQSINQPLFPWATLPRWPCAVRSPHAIWTFSLQTRAHPCSPSNSPPICRYSPCSVRTNQWNFSIFSTRRRWIWLNTRRHVALAPLKFWDSVGFLRRKLFSSRTRTVWRVIRFDRRRRFWNRSRITVWPSIGFSTTPPYLLLSSGTNCNVFHIFVLKSGGNYQRFPKFEVDISVAPGSQVRSGTWLIDWMIDLLVYCSIDSLSDWLIDWLIHWWVSGQQFVLLLFFRPHQES